MVLSKYNTPSRWRNALYKRLIFFFDCFFSMAQKYPQTTNKTIIFSILVQYVFFRFRNEPSNPWKTDEIHAETLHNAQTNPLPIHSFWTEKKTDCPFALRFVADPSDVHTALTNFVSTDKAINHGFSGLIPDNDFPVPDKIADKTRATLRDDTTTILSPENDRKTYRQ